MSLDVYLTNVIKDHTCSNCGEKVLGHFSIHDLLPVYGQNDNILAMCCRFEGLRKSAIELLDLVEKYERLIKEIEIGTRPKGFLDKVQVNVMCEQALIGHFYTEVKGE